MVLNQDGSLQVQLGETEIGQGADTAYTQMAADVVGAVSYTHLDVYKRQDSHDGARSAGYHLYSGCAPVE